MLQQELKKILHEELSHFKIVAMSFVISGGFYCPSSTTKCCKMALLCIVSKGVESFACSKEEHNHIYMIYMMYKKKLKWRGKQKKKPLKLFS